MTQHDPRSPCIGTCALDPETETCRGCGRTLAEIAGWPDFSAAEKWFILRQLETRKSARLRDDGD